jgi:nicotinate-nucleotide adenylyltransferase
MKPENPRIVIYGGSFNPVHQGHVLTVSYLLGDPDAWVVVLPAMNHPHGKNLRPFDDRMAMLEDAMSIFGKRVQISDFEREHKPPNTKTLLHLLREKYPTFPMTLAVGIDCWRDRTSWHRWDLIEEMVEIQIIGRQGVGMESPMPTVEMPDISSSAIRKALNEDRAGDVRHLLPHKVYERILLKGWYLDS